MESSRSSDRMPFDRVANTAVIAISLLTTSCATPSQSDLQNEVAAIAPVGRPISTALSKAGAAGFECTGYAPMTCQRRVSFTVTGCTQNFNILLDSASGRVAKITYIWTACAGP